MPGESDLWVPIVAIVITASCLGGAYILFRLYLDYLKYLRKSHTRTGIEEDAKKAEFRRRVVKRAALASLLTFIAIQTTCLIPLASTRLLNSNLLIYSFIFSGLASSLMGLYLVSLTIGHDWIVKAMDWLISRFKSS